MKVLRTYDLSPDGVPIEVNWERMSIGASIFVPCIDTEEAIAQATRIFEAKNWKLEHRVRVESGKIGLRIWRIV